MVYFQQKIEKCWKNWPAWEIFSSPANFFSCFFLRWHISTKQKFWENWPAWEKLWPVFSSPAYFFLWWHFSTKQRNAEKIGRPGRNSGQSSPARPIFFSYSLANIAWQINIGSPRLTPLFICFKMINMDRCYEVIWIQLVVVAVHMHLIVWCNAGCVNSLWGMTTSIDTSRENISAVMFA